MWHPAHIRFNLFTLIIKFILLSRSWNSSSDINMGSMTCSRKPIYLNVLNVYTLNGTFVIRCKLVIELAVFANFTLNHINARRDKIRPKVIAELHVKRVEVSINCFREKSDAISSNSLVLYINLTKYVDIKIIQAHASIIHAA